MPIGIGNSSPTTSSAASMSAVHHIIPYQRSNCNFDARAAQVPQPYNYSGEALYCAAPVTGYSQDGRFRTNNSSSGFASSGSSTPSLSNTPILMAFASPNVADWLQSVEPQSPQKNIVTVLPLSATLSNSLGVPLVTENPSLRTSMLVECVEPVILRQSRQWQRAWELDVST